MAMNHLDSIVYLASILRIPPGVSKFQEPALTMKI